MLLIGVTRPNFKIPNSQVKFLKGDLYILLVSSMASVLCTDCCVIDYDILLGILRMSYVIFPKQISTVKCKTCKLFSYHIETSDLSARDSTPSVSYQI